jgi:iron complex transport system ATP-binding protein
MILLDDISLFFPGHPARILDTITWRIGRGETWVLFGPNGSGKTRLLEIIAGYLYPSTGSVTRFGLGQGEGDLRDLRRRIGYVSTPMRERFPAGETVTDVVLSGARASVGLYGEPAPEEEERAAGLLGSAGLADKAGRRFGTLSDGERQKVLMLRAVMPAPELLLLDEPAMGLDLPAREGLLAALASLCAGKEISVVYVTHYTDEITPFFKNIFMIKNGREFFSGRVEGGLTDGRLSGIFGTRISVIRRNDRFYAAPA